MKKNDVKGSDIHIITPKTFQFIINTVGKLSDDRSVIIVGVNSPSVPSSSGGPAPQGMSFPEARSTPVQTPGDKLSSKLISGEACVYCA